jgi:sec-independent protein translocase protein TatB
MAASAQDKVREELGPEFDEVDWRALDPRQYDPRRIVREALTDVVDIDDPLGLRGNGSGGKQTSPGGPGEKSTGQPGGSAATASGPQPTFDPDAT